MRSGGVAWDRVVWKGYTGRLERRMTKKNPYSPLDPNRGIGRLRSEWKERIEKFVDGKPVLPVQFRFFIDGYKFYLDCHKEASHHADYVRRLYENWSEHPTPKTPIDVEVLYSIGRGILQAAEDSITAKFIQLGTEAGETFIPAFDLALGALTTSSTREDKINTATAVIDPFYTVDIYAGEKPNIKGVQRRIWQNLKNYHGQKGDAGWELLQENSLLLQEGKYKNNSGIIKDCEEYEQFIQSFEVGRSLDQTHLAITRYDIKERGGIYLSEKGVDAKLILGLIEAKDASDTDAICLFSNDTDYYPILEWIKANTDTPVFLAVLDGHKSVSQELKKTVGNDGIIDVNARLLPWTEIRDSSEFEIARENFSMAEYLANTEAAQKVMEEEMEEYFRNQTNEPATEK